jgi:hypothetical protein
LSELTAPNLSLAKRIWMIVLRAYLIGAVALIGFKVIQVAIGL